MIHFYRQVPKLGNVALSRHAQSEAQADRITDEDVRQALHTPDIPDVEEGFNIMWRQRQDVRLVIIKKPTPFKGAMLVKTIYRVKPQAVAKKR